MSSFDFETRKSVHINLTKSTHSELRVLLIRKGLSMQEVFDSFAAKLTSGDERLSFILDEIVSDKREKAIKRVASSDQDSIYRLIEEKED